MCSYLNINSIATTEGRLAEVLVLDQFSRNVFHDTPKPLRKTRRP